MFQTGDRHPAWSNALKPRGQPGPSLTLASGGKAHYTIILPTLPTTQDQKAAADLAHWLKVMTAAVFPIFRESAYVIPEKIISIGQTTLLNQACRQDARANLGDEGYAIAFDKGNLFLRGGRRRGPINAVYALLEEDLGCRWFDERSASIPRVKTLRFRPVPRRYVPALELRDPYYWDAWDGNWSLRNRTSAAEARIPEAWGGHPRAPGPLAREIGYLPHKGGSWFVHTFVNCVPPQRYFKKHPEYFTEANGQRGRSQLCLTNPEVLRITLGNVRRAIRGTPECRIISISPNDGAGLCTCAKCRAVERVEGSKSGALIRFVNAVADVVHKEFPAIRVSTLAYVSTLMPPKKTRPRDNVVIMLCTDSHAWAWPFLPVTKTQTFQKALRAWEATGARVHIWDYTVNFSHESLPMPNLPVVCHNIRFFLRHGVKGVMLEGADQSYGGENAALRAWVWGKQLWDAAWDTQTLMRDFIFGYYASAAAPIWKYNLELLKIWRRLSAAPGKRGFRNSAVYHIRFSPNAPFLSLSFLRRAFKLFAEAERLARDPETRRRIQLAKLPILYAHLCQELGFVVSRFGGLMSPGRRLRRLAGGRSDRRNYRPLVDELATIVRHERIERFVGGWPWHFTGPTQAQQNLKAWRTMAGPMPRIEARELSPVWGCQVDVSPQHVGAHYTFGNGIKKQPVQVSPTLDDSRWNTARMRWDISVHADVPQWAQAQRQDASYPLDSSNAWFRQWMRVPRGFLKHTYVLLVFLGVCHEAMIWIDGHWVGAHTCASTGLDDAVIMRHTFAFNVRNLLNRAGRSLLAVRVTPCPGRPSGIWRPVWLVAADKPWAAMSPLLETFLAAKQRARKS